MSNDNGKTMVAFSYYDESGREKIKEEYRCHIPSPPPQEQILEIITLLLELPSDQFDFNHYTVVPDKSCRDYPILIVSGGNIKTETIRGDFDDMKKILTEMKEGKWEGTPL
ncbi:hypothetical protein ACFLZS_00020 [Patescibacteria group bacterium]